MVSFCLLLLNDAETQSRLGHQESEGHGWQPKEGPSPAPPTTREGASCGCSWGRAAASCPEKGAVPCLLFQPALVCTGVGSHMLQPRRDLDQMATPLHPSSGIEMGFGRAGVKGGGPAGDLGQDPGLMSYPGPAELPAHLELGKMRQAHLRPLGTGTRRALLLALCLQPSGEGGTAVLAWENPADTRLV